MTALLYLFDATLWGLIGITKTTYNMLYYGINGERRFEPKPQTLTEEDLHLIKEIIHNSIKEPLDVKRVSKGVTLIAD
tara:strand:- start:259 stop:492 length:234 start_codon:yes stop_codon:yes gene_type:complete